MLGYNTLATQYHPQILQVELVPKSLETDSLASLKNHVDLVFNDSGSLCYSIHTDLFVCLDE